MTVSKAKYMLGLKEIEYLPKHEKRWSQQSWNDEEEGYFAEFMLNNIQRQYEEEGPVGKY